MSGSHRCSSYARIAVRETTTREDFLVDNNIQDKVVVITGASSGLGEATARHLSALGATVVLAVVC